MTACKECTGRGYRSAQGRETAWHIERCECRQGLSLGHDIARLIFVSDLEHAEPHARRSALNVLANAEVGLPGAGLQPDALRELVSAGRHLSRTLSVMESGVGVDANMHDLDQERFQAALALFDELEV